MPAQLSRTELIALVAAMFASVAFSLDSMLPALPEIGRELSPGDPNRAGLILTFFVFGLGLGTFVTGPLSDAYGRRPVILVGAVFFILSSALAWVSQSLELMLAARLAQGLSAAAPRIAATAVLRDCFAGRAMARVMSFVMMIFMIVPAIAPLLGSFVIAALGWHGIYLSFVAFMSVIAVWVLFRLPETLAPQDRRPMRLATLFAALGEMFANPTVRLSIMVQALSMGALFSMLTLVQPVYDRIFDRAESFPLWFGAVAVLSGTGSLINAALVVRVGMRRMVTWTFLGQIAACLIYISLLQTDLNGTAEFALFVAWQTSVFLVGSMTMGNLNAIAMEPMGHIAGLAASIIGGVATVLAAPIATTVGLSFDGTVFPLVLGILVISVAAYLLMLLMARVEARQTA